MSAAAGAAGGIIIGWGARKLARIVVKLLVMAVSLQVGILIYLDQEGIISLNQSKLNSLITNLSPSVPELAALPVGPPSIGSSALGLAVGWKIGGRM